VHAVALCSPCAHHVFNYTAKRFALRATAAGWNKCVTSRASVAAASVQSCYLSLSRCQLLSQGNLGVRLAGQRRRRQALRRQRCATWPLFTRPAWPQRTLHSHELQRESRKLSVHAVALFSPCAHHVLNYTAQALLASAFVFLVRSSFAKKENCTSYTSRSAEPPSQGASGETRLCNTTRATTRNL
jgi:hypothetical protein